MTTDWRDDGVRVIPGDALDTNTPQTPGMNRAAAVTHDRVGSGRVGEAVGRDGHDPPRCPHRCAPPRRAGERDLRGPRAGPDEVGREPGVHRGGRAGRVHLRAAVRPAPGDQRARRRAPGVRADPLRAGAGRGEPRHRRRRRSRARAVGRSGTPAPLTRLVRTRTVPAEMRLSALRRSFRRR
ncbi:putative mannose-6-phosphate isomerase [Pseudonocardia sp. Ae168_Ps1]|nr:putative mannose-6-phosphate isomerase [Pseudonocardia sp. Ae150A_Ps1]OLL78433.1 putative mannose-6-phosphate isomerase [Pseudonocardia sp. Ae168_Ps1]OLL87441.1 putative mannose-6-phosphate isomerase [Pseudonocardia sp. Ae263_Ps1]OLL92530.1 putative mannose-6-phosphate isomerase [Pseudonocardia sp. Ae356_Ps1]